MKKHLAPSALFLALFLIASCGGKAPAADAPAADSVPSITAQPEETAAPAVPAGKYEVKSGIVKADSEVMGLKISEVFYFDDYGAKGRYESYFDGALSDVKISDGVNSYTLKVAKKTATKDDYATSSFPGKFSLDMVKGGKGITILADMTLCGVVCQAYSSLYDGTTIVLAGARGMQLYLKSDSKDGVMKTPTSIEFDVPVPADKFTLPADFTVTE
jgi:hypothetical protein